MTAAVRSQNVPFLPPAWAALLKRAALFAAGLGVLLMCAAALLALVSYSPEDPSLNTATNLTPQNALGFAGAIMADALLQAVGLGALAIVFAVGAWGVRLMKSELVSWLWLRTVAGIASALFLAVGLELIPAFDAWPVAAGLGGSAGEILLNLLAVHEGAAVGLTSVVLALQMTLGLAAAALGAGLLLWAMTVRFTVAGAACVAAAQMAARGVVVLARVPSWVLARLPQAAPAEKPAKPKRERAQPAPVQIEEDEELDTPVQARTIVDEDDADEESAEAAPRARETAVVEVRPKPAKPSKREMAARQGDLLPAARKDFDLPHLDILTPPDRKSVV